jgi:hypothetical protein
MFDETSESLSEEANALMISRPLASETTKSGESANARGDCLLDTWFDRNLKIVNLFGIRTVAIS